MKHFRKRQTPNAKPLNEHSLLGSGGREHALAWKISQSSHCKKLFIAPGNAGTSECGENVSISINDFPAIRNFVLENKIEMVIVGPEEPLVNGIVDFFLERFRTKKNINSRSISKRRHARREQGFCKRIYDAE